MGTGGERLATSEWVLWCGALEAASRLPTLIFRENNTEKIGEVWKKCWSAGEFDKRRK